MRHVLTIVEQLDRAAGELSTDHPINSRLALILVDNATEVMLHRQCMDRLESDSWTSAMRQALQSAIPANPSDAQAKLLEDLGGPGMRPTQRARARGKYFEDKLKVLQQMGDLTQTERRFIKIAHDYRNELYHIGLTHDDIIRSIAGQYYRLSCDLFGRMENLRLFTLSFSSSDTYTEVARRYLPMHNGRVAFSDVETGVLAEKLLDVLPDGIPELAKTLASSARKSIEEVLENFEFLVRDSPFGFDAEEMLEFAQWQFDIEKAVEEQDLIGLWVDPSYRESLDRVATNLKENWKQQHTSIPCENWRHRATALESEADPLIAMDLFQSLRDDMSYLEEAIQSATLELDRQIQQASDIARGK